MPRGGLSLHQTTLELLLLVHFLDSSGVSVLEEHVMDSLCLNILCTFRSSLSMSIIDYGPTIWPSSCELTLL